MKSYTSESYFGFDKPKTMEFKSDKTGLALVREAKALLGLSGVKMRLVVECGNFKQWQNNRSAFTLVQF